MFAALSSLCKQRPVAASKVKVAAKIALKYSNDYKMAVHSIESFIRKAAPMDKLCGVYVLDAICRQPKSQMFRERFAIRYNSCTFHYLNDFSAFSSLTFFMFLSYMNTFTGRSFSIPVLSPHIYIKLVSIVKSKVHIQHLMNGPVASYNASPSFSQAERYCHSCK